MIKLVYAVKDVKAGLFHNPFFLNHDVEAVRSLQSVLKKEDTMLAQYPEDFELWNIGEFNDNNAFIKQPVSLRFVVSCVSLIKSPSTEGSRKADEGLGTQAAGMQRSGDDGKKKDNLKLNK